MQLSASCNAAGFSAMSDDVFGRIAARYDLLCDLFSFCVHRRWKRRVAEVISQEPWNGLLDVACGTGDIGFRVLKHGAHDAHHIVACDISPKMLEIAHRRLSQEHHHPVEFRCLDAQYLSDIAPNSVDVYSISLGLKICERRAVLRPKLRAWGGRVCAALRSSLPKWRRLPHEPCWGRAAARGDVAV